MLTVLTDSQQVDAVGAGARESLAYKLKKVKLAYILKKVKLDEDDA